MPDDVPEANAEIDDGGHRKSFWGHLADLRTALVRSGIAICVALVACLFLSPWLVKVLEEPLRHIHMFEKPKPTVTLEIGSAKLGPYEVTREQFPGLPPGDAPNVVFRVGTAPMGKEQVMTLTMEPPSARPDGPGCELRAAGEEGWGRGRVCDWWRDWGGVEGLRGNPRKLSTRVRVLEALPLRVQRWRR